MSNRVAARLESWLRPGLDPRYVASAVLAVMRTPTEAMVKAGDDAQTETRGPDMGVQVAMSSVVPWRAMIDAALNE